MRTVFFLQGGSMNIREAVNKRLSGHLLYSQSETSDPIVYCKLFLIVGAATWYLTEYDGDDICFGYVTGLQEDEWGYVSIREMEALAPLIECDLYFTAQKWSEVKQGSK
jgi:Protein of unknown function (DUF2958)